MIRAVLLDLDGVLVDSFEVWWRLIADVARRRGHPPASRARFVATFGQGVDADIEDFFPGDPREAIERAYEARFVEHLDGLTVVDGAAALLDALRRGGVRSCVVTNTPTGLARRILEHARLAPAELVGSSDVAAAKPDPSMVRLACRRCRVGADEAVMVGDSAYDRLAAASAGVRFVGFRRPGEVRVERLDELADLARLESLLAR